MAKSKSKSGKSTAASQPQPAPRLYLCAPQTTEADDAAALLAAALGAGDVAAVLMAPAAADERGAINAAKALAAVVQQAGAAFLLKDRPELVARAGADGAHLTGLDIFTRHAPALRPDRIAGCGGLTTRHDAMSAAEAEADYVMFGEPDSAAGTPTLDTVMERVAWWAEVFETPCVAYAARLGDIAPLVAAGADFIALGDAIWSDARGPAAAIAEVMSYLVRETVPA